MEEERELTLCQIFSEIIQKRLMQLKQDYPPIPIF